MILESSALCSMYKKYAKRENNTLKLITFTVELVGYCDYTN